ncbi:right-handed parallel beta-helix repeat-containing protein [Desulfosporosinus fructosivorans]
MKIGKSKSIVSLFVVLLLLVSSFVLVADKKAFAATPPVTWSPTDKGSAVTLSNGNLTLASSTGVGEYATLQDFFDAYAGNPIELPKGDYLITSTLIIREGTTLLAYGSSFYSTTNITLLALESNVKIYGLELHGINTSETEYKTHTASSIGINLVGNLATPIENILLEDCYIHDFANSGVYGTFVNSMTINKCKIFRISYAGILFTSSSNIKVLNSHIKDLSPNGSGGNAYNIAFTRSNSVTDDLEVLPLSRDCLVDSCLIENNTLWEGLDTHGGENIRFTNNTIRGVKTPIAFVGVNGYGTQVNLFPPNRCLADGNTIYGIGTGIGIVLAGNATNRAKANTLSNNTLVDCGINSETITAGAIKFYLTEGTVIDGNTLQDSYCSAIDIYSYNEGFVVTGNSIIDVRHESTTAAGIIFRSTGNKGHIASNFIIKSASPPTGATVSDQGVLFVTTTGNEVTLGDNENTFTNPYVNCIGSHVVFL